MLSNSYTTYYLLSYIFGSIPKRYRKSYQNQNQSQVLYGSPLGKQTAVEHHIYITEFLFTLPGCKNTEKPTREATTTRETTEGTTATGKETSVKPTERLTTVGTTKQTTRVTTGVSTATQPPATNATATPAPPATEQPSTSAMTTGQTTAAPTPEPPTTTAPVTTELPTTQAPATIVPEDKTSLNCSVAIVGGGKNFIGCSNLYLKRQIDVCPFCTVSRLFRCGTNLIMLYKVVFTFKSADETPVNDHSNQNY